MGHQEASLPIQDLSTPWKAAGAASSRGSEYPSSPCSHRPTHRGTGGGICSFKVTPPPRLPHAARGPPSSRVGVRTAAAFATDSRGQARATAMFGWKRQRKEEESAPAPAPAAGCIVPAQLDCSISPLGSSPAAVVDAALLSTDSAASSLCSEPCSEDEGAGPCSIELAARGAAGPMALTPAEPQAGPSSSSSSSTCSVRAKAAFFEALIRCNTTAHIQCSADGGACCSSYCSSGAGSPAALEMLPAPGSSGGSAAGSQAAAMQAVSQEAWQEEGFSEVQLVLRLPRGAPPPGGGRFGSVAEMEALIEQLQGLLEAKERQRQAAVDAYHRRTSECENLMRVVRELADSRSKAVSQRASLAERYNDLQQEYHRMLRIADLSRTVSKENMAKTSRTRSELRRVQLELHATRSHAQHLTEKHKKVRVENALLKEKVTLLERLDFEEVQESECKKLFTRYRVAETY
ncbi:hypothetical protein ABPG75_009878 [Micractinium tetrahymenae]